VSDVYLRGIYESAKGAFNFNHDTVENVQGNEASIGMFAFEASGEMVANRVTSANDAISANWSKGIKFIGNKITKSQSGVHTDNNGGAGGVADLIEGNKVSECAKDGYGVWVFVPFVSATVTTNRVKGCAVGLATFGGAVPGQGPTFSKNKVDGTGATTAEPPTVGAYLTTDQLGFAFGDLTVAMTGNSISHFGDGVFVTQTSGGQANVTASGNSIHGNGLGATGEPGTKVEAANNWWGCSQGPNIGAKCDKVTGTVNYTPWLTSKP
jgi:nitrous oxidase accessory protein NosD